MLKVVQNWGKIVNYPPMLKKDPHLCVQHITIVALVFLFSVFASFVFFFTSAICSSNEDAILYYLMAPQMAADSKTSRSLRSHSGAMLPLIIPLYVLCFICFCFCLFSGVSKQT